jgi:alpha-N-arabinofuranosidase
MRWRERFDGGRLPMQWMTLHPPAAPWYSTGRNGLRIAPSTMPLGAFATRAGQPSYLAHRLQHHHATIDITLSPAGLDAGEQAGIALLQNERAFYAVLLGRDARGDAVVLRRRASKDDPVAGVELARVPVAHASEPLSLRLVLAAPRLDVAYAIEPGRWTWLRRDLDASLLSVDSAGGFIGNTFGPYAVAASAAGE